MSEQEQLAKLVGNQELEPVDTAFLLEDALKEKLGGVSSKVLSQVEEEIEAHGDVVASKKAKRIGSDSKKESVSPQSLPSGYSTEKILLNLYGARDEIITAFQEIGLNTKAAERLSESIAKIENCIKTAGGDVDRFIPLNHLSGLSAPNRIKSAERVIETTLQCYTMGKVEKAKIKDGGKSIEIHFSGKQGNMYYRVNGEITSEEWTGNEAIDYVYTPGEGKMTVKAYENGKWVVKNSSDDNKYKVLWDLEEIPEKEMNKKIVENEKEELSPIQNNLDEEIGDPLSS